MLGAVSGSDGNRVVVVRARLRRCLVLWVGFELRGRAALVLWMRGEESSDSESGRMEESSVRRSLEVLCQELNMDEQTASEAMDNFTSIWNTYTLEVNDWLRFGSVRGGVRVSRGRCRLTRYEPTSASALRPPVMIYINT